MKYAVIGLGAIGSIIGGILAKSGQKVVLIGKKDQVQEINKKGLKIDGINGQFLVENVDASIDLSSVIDSDIILICVKSQDTEALAQDLKKFIKKSSIIISLQNGVRNSKVLKDITGNATFSGIVLFNVVYLKPAEVTMTLKGSIILETESKHEEEIKNFADTLNKFGIKTKIETDVEGYLWGKLIINLQNAVTALTGQTIKEAIMDKDCRAILIATMQEGMDVLQKSSIPYKTLPEIDPKVTIRRFKIFNSALLKIGSRILKLNETARGSMWQSLYRGKQTEVDYLNGEIVEAANKHNMDAPINKKLVQLIKEAEKTGNTKSFEASKLREILNIK